MIDVTPADVHAVHAAAIEYRAMAADRQERMPTSAAAMIGKAEQLESLLAKLVPLLEPHQQLAYPSARTIPLSAAQHAQI